MADISGERLTHLTHAEDNLYNGPEAADHMIQTLYAINDMLKGSTPKKQIAISIKWDGAPSTIAASDFNGETFVSDKVRFFAKNRRIARTPDEVREIFGKSEDLAAKMLGLLVSLKELAIPAGQIWQGDFLFDASSLKKETINNESFITFHPNTIIYAIPTSDPLAKKILQANVGVAWHTRYKGTSFDDLRISYDASVEELTDTPNVFCVDATIPNIAGKVTMTAEEASRVDTLLQKITDSYSELGDIISFISTNPELQLALNTFENAVIKSEGRQFAVSSSEYVENFRSWMEQRYNDVIASKKKPQTKAAFEEQKLQALEMIDQYSEPLGKLIELQKLVVIIKEFFVNKLNSLGMFQTMLKTIDRGFIPTGQEGFAVSDTEGNIQKLVSRLEFSAANFSKDIVKGWMSDARQQERAIAAGSKFTEFFKLQEAQLGFEYEKNASSVLKKLGISTGQAAGASHDKPDLVKGKQAMNNTFHEFFMFKESAKSDAFEHKVATDLQTRFKKFGIKSERPKVGTDYSDVRVSMNGTKAWIEVKMNHTDNLSNPRFFYRDGMWGSTYETPVAALVTEYLNNSDFTKKFVKTISKYSGIRNPIMVSSKSSLSDPNAVPIEVMRSFFDEGIWPSRYILNEEGVDLGSLVIKHYTQGKTEPADYMQAGDDFYLLGTSDPFGLRKANQSKVPMLKGIGDLKVRISTRSQFYEIQAEVKIMDMPESPFSILGGSEKINPFDVLFSKRVGK